MLLGDSKTSAPLGTWQAPLAADLTAASGFLWSYVNRAVAGASLEYLNGVQRAPESLAWLLDPVPSAYAVPAVLINYGVNDLVYPKGLGGGPSGIANLDEATWKANLGAMLDAIHAKWPTATVYVTRPWMRGYDADCDTLAGWIATVLSTRGPWAVAGDDERVWLRGADNGATMTSDGLHYSAAGNTEKAAQMKAVLGY